MMERPAVGTGTPICDDTVGSRARNHNERQELPDTGSFLPAHREPQDQEPQAGDTSPSSPARCRGAFALDTAVALAKAAEIAARGAGVWNAATFAYASTSIDDAFRAHRARFTLGSLLGLLCQERDLTPRAVAKFSRRNAVLGRIWIQIAQDVVDPLQQGTMLACEGLICPPPASGS